MTRMTFCNHHTTYIVILFSPNIFIAEATGVKHILNNKRQILAGKIHISLTLSIVLLTHFSMGHVALERSLSLLPKANSSGVPVLLLTPHHSSTNPTAREVGAHALLNGVLQSVRGH